jgi:uncharacterized protein
MKKIVISGGTGFIGKALTKELIRGEYEVVVLSRGVSNHNSDSGVRFIPWDAKSSGDWERELEDAHTVINLAGENIGAGLWTKSRKGRILSSRIDAGKALVAAIGRCTNKPRSFIQASAIGIYGISETVEKDEDSPMGNDFLARTGKQWEESTEALESMGIQRAIIRTGIVLDLKEGAFPKVVIPFRFFVGGKLGTGKQWFSWIHLKDEVNAITHIIKNDLRGIYNLTAPEPERNEEVARIISNVMQKPNWIPVPSIALQLLLGEMSTLVLDGQRVLPKRLIESGYKFGYERLEEAVRDLYQKQ